MVPSRPYFAYVFGDSWPCTISEWTGWHQWLAGMKWVHVLAASLATIDSRKQFGVWTNVWTASAWPKLKCGQNNQPVPMHHLWPKKTCKIYRKLPSNPPTYELFHQLSHLWFIVSIWIVCRWNGKVYELHIWWAQSRGREGNTPPPRHFLSYHIKNTEGLTLFGFKTIPDNLMEQKCFSELD